MKSILKNTLDKLAKLSDEIVEANFEPATKKQLNVFVKNAQDRNIPQEIINQLVGLYSIANEFEAIALVGFHSCDDEILWEWWTDDQCIWLSQRDDTTLRWIDNKFCMGDASNPSFGYEYEFDTLIKLLTYCHNEMNEYE